MRDFCTCLGTKTGVGGLPNEDFGNDDRGVLMALGTHKEMLLPGNMAYVVGAGAAVVAVWGWGPIRADDAVAGWPLALGFIQATPTGPARQPPQKN